MKWFKHDTSPSDELGRDLSLAQALETLDPVSQDPNYWLWFHSWVMTDAARELSRRRLLAELTVGDVLTSWARTVVPTALLVAGLAAIILGRSDVVSEPYPISVEELLISDIAIETSLLLRSTNDADGVVAFASEVY